ncbi:hypothetical protein RM590_11295 [Streptomyces sp. DSM 44938]|uniref:Uncharacterized protein n=1 Tax=Streptomyces litchfieldiae TaxID=3075543 RepID=A0ABU2MRG7_9ACTN|nr:hypothetical protein [Streptomyces sp. DSM 44938]
MSGVELAERDIRYIQAWLNEFTVEISDDVTPAQAKEMVFRHIEEQVMSTYGL